MDSRPRGPIVRDGIKWRLKAYTRWVYLYWVRKGWWSRTQVLMARDDPEVRKHPQVQLSDNAGP